MSFRMIDDENSNVIIEIPTAPEDTGSIIPTIEIKELDDGNQLITISNLYNVGKTEFTQVGQRSDAHKIALFQLPEQLKKSDIDVTKLDSEKASVIKDLIFITNEVKQAAEAKYKKSGPEVKLLEKPTLPMMSI
jgi:hypothetical protein